MLLIFSCACGTSTPPCTVLPGATARDCAAVRDLALPASLPAARGNLLANDPQAALFGFHMFFDARFSKNTSIRCASCHQPEQHFTDGDPTPSKGLGPVPRNTPTLLNAAWNRWYFWDGRADTLWSQPLFALENPNEMGTTRLAIAHTIHDGFAAEYTALFGALPNMTAWPADGKPGDPAFDQLPAADREAVNRLVANVGKCIEAYVRHVAAGPAPLDAYLAGNANAIPAAAQRGLGVFVRAGCIQCHSGKNLTDDAFHNLGVPEAAGADPDPGRATGLPILAADVFNAAGAYYDGTPEATVSAASAASFMGAFKTPSLRNLDISAPYGHNGSFAALEDIVDFHLAGGLPPALGTLDSLLQPVALTGTDRGDLLAFLHTMQGTYRGNYGEPPYWWDWPDR